MQDADQPEPSEQPMAEAEQRQEEQRNGADKQQQDGQDAKKPKLIDLTQRSNRVCSACRPQHTHGVLQLDLACHLVLTHFAVMFASCLHNALCPCLPWILFFT